MNFSKINYIQKIKSKSNFFVLEIKKSINNLKKLFFFVLEPLYFSQITNKLIKSTIIEK